MDKLTCAREMAAPVLDVGSKFMMDPQTFGAATDVGMEPNEVFYVVGRFGLLGKLPAERALEIGGIFPPDWFLGMWTEAVEAFDPKKAGERFFECCCEWGRRNLSGVEGLEKFCEQAEIVVDNADTSQAPLVAALREMPRPEDLPAKAAVLVHALRELRFARHLDAINESEISPLEAILAGPGEGMAKMFRWTEPFPEVSEDIKTRRAEVEEQTNISSAEDFESLDDSQRADLVEAVNQIFTALKAAAEAS